MNRNRHVRKQPLGLAAACIAAAVLAFAVTAEAETDPGWQIRFYAAAIDMRHGSAPGPSNGLGFEMDAGAGLGLNAEYRFSRRLGVDLGILGGVGVDVGSRTGWAGAPYWANQETITITPLTAGLDIHLTPEARFDLYACPMVALVQYGGLSFRSGPGGVRTDWDFDEDFALGAALGIGVPFGRQRWSFQASLAYLDSSLEGSGGDGVRIRDGYDSTIFGLGFGYRFGGRGG